MNANKSQSASDVVDLSEIIDLMSNELACLLGPSIHFTIRRVATDGTVPIRAPREEVEDLLRHLALDAYDSMPGGGMVSFHTGRLRGVDRCVALVAHEVPASADSEKGPRSKRRIRKGRSLGLGATHNIVQHTGGHFHVSCRGEETVLTICFPLAE